MSEHLIMVSTGGLTFLKLLWFDWFVLLCFLLLALQAELLYVQTQRDYVFFTAKKRERYHNVNNLLLTLLVILKQRNVWVSAVILLPKINSSDVW